ncbi:MULTISPECIES: sulfite exporter TauE/SafE family protein [unclassified Streptomyces]|uniref:sulfite exporter TauE/SafE family protein n=1 Tax=unclassified Streptomyces TaxID=2593676 RepID=UPI000BF1FEED|nr:MULTISPECIES: sulfite exporter TauE/SafE family protein [unclassified Streptomyces]PVC86682.1 sulfite exporter TauE/SafE family protein [Streptomyces sp. CS014]
MSTLVLALVAGTVIGMALGALGGGGSVLAVPALIYLLGFSATSATTASLIIVTATSATALYAHARDGHVDWKAGTLFAAAGVVPAFLAGAAAGHVPETALTAAFAVIAALAALRMLRPSAAGAAEEVRPAKAAGAGAGLGAVTGFLGVGGGFLAVPALVGVLGLQMNRAVGTSLLIITVNSAAALGARSGTGGDLRWEVIAPFAGAAILGAWDGKRLAAKVAAATLQRVFAFTLLAVAAFMAIDSIA